MIISKNIDLNEELVVNPLATFFCSRVKGDSMKNASINDGDVLIVDRSLVVRNNDIVVAVIDGELTVKRFNKLPDKVLLQTENPDYAPLLLPMNETSRSGESLQQLSILFDEYE